VVGCSITTNRRFKFLDFVTDTFSTDDPEWKRKSVSESNRLSYNTFFQQTCNLRSSHDCLFIALYIPVILVPQASSKVAEDVTQTNGNETIDDGRSLTDNRNNSWTMRAAALYATFVYCLLPLLLIAGFYGRTAHKLLQRDACIEDSSEQRRKRNKAARFVVFLKRIRLKFPSYEQ
jgi:hypothetical protein